jgi:6-methylsalicylate decarboxylase
MTTVDLHQHLWPPGFVAALRGRTHPPLVDGDRLVTREGRFPWQAEDHDPARRLADMDRDGIDRAVLCLQPSLGLEALPEEERDALERAWIDGIGEIVHGAGGRFCALAPSRVATGFAGTSVGCSALLAAPGTAAATVIDSVDSVAGLLFVHPEAEQAVPPGRPEWWNWLVGYPGQMQAAYFAWLAGGRARWPQLTVVFALLAGGAPFQHERLAQRGVPVRSARDPRVLFDTASYGRQAIELTVEMFGVERVVYGSDAPVIDPRGTLRAVQGFGDSVARFLMTDNPARLFAGRGTGRDADGRSPR